MQVTYAFQFSDLASSPYKNKNACHAIPELPVHMLHSGFGTCHSKSEADAVSAD